VTGGEDEDVKHNVEVNQEKGEKNHATGRGEEVNHIVVDKIQGQNHSDTNNNSAGSDSKTPWNVTLDPATEARLKIVTVPANGPINVSNVSNTSSSTSATSTPQSTSGNISEPGGNDTNDTNDTGELVHQVGMDSVISKGTPQRRSPPMLVKQPAPQDHRLQRRWKMHPASERLDIAEANEERARHTPAHAKQEEPEQEQAESATEKKDHSETKEHKEPK